MAGIGHGGDAGPPPSGVDAAVGATADARTAHDDVLLRTTDGEDFHLLGSLAAHAGRLSVLVA